MTLSHLGSLFSWSSRVLLTDTLSFTKKKLKISAAQWNFSWLPPLFPKSSLVGPLCSLIKKQALCSYLSERTYYFEMLRLYSSLPLQRLWHRLPQVSLTMLHRPLLLAFPPYPPCMSIFPFHSDHGTYLHMSSEHTHVLGFKNYMHTDDSSTFLHPGLLCWVPNT